MPSRTRQSLIKCKLKGSYKIWVRKCLAHFRGVGNYSPELSQEFVRSQDLYDVVTLLSLNHLQFNTGVDSQEYLQKGFDVALDFFLGDWKEESDKKKCISSWWEPFRDSLLLALLAERWDELEQICDWVKADQNPGYIVSVIEADYIFLKVILSVAAGLRKKKMRALASMEQKILDSRLPGPIALFEAWDAARSNDQAGFEKGMTAALKKFSSRRGTRTRVIDWIALHESIVNLAARRLGLQHPELPPELDAYLITPETIGIK